MASPEETVSMAPEPEQLAAASSARRRKRESPGGSQRFFSDVLGPLLLGIVITVVFYLFVVPQLPEDVSMRLTERTWIPYVCAVLLFWHLSCVLLRLLLWIKPNARILHENLIPPGANELTDADLMEISKRAAEVESRRRGRLLTRRILLAVAHLSVRKDTSEVGDILRRRAEVDRARAANAYAVPKFLFWAIPILGFVGTVLGIGMAVMHLEGALGDVNELQGLMEQLGKVASSLGVAFDTTLVALLMSIIAMLAQTLVRQQESRLLADIEDYLTYRLQSRLRSDTLDEQSQQPVLQILQRIHQLEEQAAQEQAVGLKNIQEALRQLPALVATELQAVSGSQVKTAERMMALLEKGSQQISQLVGKNLVDTSRQAMKQLEDARAELAEGAGDQVVRIISEAQELIKQSIEPLQGSMQEMVQGLERILQDGRQLVTLQEVMTTNLDQLTRVNNLDQTFQELQQSLISLRPVLDRLSRPIPVRLSLTNVETPDAPKPRDILDPDETLPG